MFKKGIIAILVAVQMLAIAPAFAGSKGRMNTAALLTGAALYSWGSYSHKHSAGRRNTAIATTAGSAYAWYRYNQEKKAEKRRERARAAAYRRAAYRNRQQANYYRARYYRVARAHRSNRYARYAHR